MTELREGIDQQQQTDAAEDLPDHPWSIPLDEITDALEVDPEQGLSPEEVENRRERHGRNYIRTPGIASPWEVLVNQLRSAMFYVLTAAAIISAIAGKIVEAIAIIAVVVINSVIGFLTEMKAVRSMKALEQMGSTTARVIRGGEEREVDAEALVPGDIAVMQEGDMVNADMRLLDTDGLEVNESAMTGESVPVKKSPDPVEEEAQIADRTCMIYKGTAITRGNAEAVVVATGMDTELGLISSLTEQAAEAATPMEKRLDTLAQRLVYMTVVVAVVVAVAGIAAGRDMVLMIETTIALAVATIPEAMPIVATIAMGCGMLRMSRHNALVKELPAVETLGATNVIAVDKTGTLTENRMTVRRIELPAASVSVSGGPLSAEGDFTVDDETVTPDEVAGLTELLEVGALCTNASIEKAEGDEGYEATGDPTEVALLIAAAKSQIRREDLIDQFPEVREVAFSSDTKMMATVHETNGEYRVAIKGAPEAVLEICSLVLTDDGPTSLSQEERDEWMERTERLAGEGLRVLALARRRVKDPDADIYESATFLGLVGMIDPPREGVAEVIQRCQNAGIRLIMATGDQSQTAFAIAREVGLFPDEGDDERRVVDASELSDPSEMSDEQAERVQQAEVVARVAPEQKLHLVDLHQRAGNTVAMTGDGVNDAPALKKADIGIAMGERGTQVARETADIVLLDDRLETIVAAVEQGRIIFGNIRQFVLYLFSVSVSEVLVVAIAFVAMANWPPPLLPLQILFLNMVTYVFPALALGTGKSPGNVMENEPRERGELIMERPQWIDLAILSVILAVPAFAALWLATEWLGLEGRSVTTVCFLTVGASQLWNVFNVRDRQSGVFINDVTRNPWVWGAVVLCVVLIGSTVAVSWLAQVLRTTWPGVEGMMLALALSLVSLVVAQIYIGLSTSAREGNDG